MSRRRRSVKKRERRRGRGSYASKRLAIFYFSPFRIKGKVYLSPKINLSTTLLKELDWKDKQVLVVRKTKKGISLSPVELTYEEAKELGREEWESRPSQ